MSKILTNTIGSTITIADTGISIPSLTAYTIPPQDYLLWAASSNILSPVGLGSIVVSDGFSSLNPSYGIDYLKGIFPTDEVSTPTVVNINVPLANTEYSVTIPQSAKEFFIKSHGLGTLRIAFSSGQTSTNYSIVWPGGAFERTRLRRNGAALDIFYRSTKPNETLELIYWS